MEMTVKQWYVSTYPTDECAAELNRLVTFDALYQAMQQGKCFYDMMDGGDTLIRERIFAKLAEMKGVDYGAIYDLWLGKM